MIAVKLKRSSWILVEYGELCDKQTGSVFMGGIGYNDDVYIYKYISFCRLCYTHLKDYK